MPFNPRRKITTSIVAGLAVLISATGVRAQEAASTEAAGWQKVNWLSGPVVAAPAVKVETSQEIKDPRTVLSTGALWNEKVDATYTQQLAAPLILSYATSSIHRIDSLAVPAPTIPVASDNFSRMQSLGLQFQPAESLTFHLNLHDAMTDPAVYGDPTMAGGAAFSAESHLPLAALPCKPELTLGFNSDHTATELNSASMTSNTAWDAQFKQPMGSLPLTAVLKGHYEEVATAGVPAGRKPTLEQSLVWKPVNDTTLQMGLRQQQYQEYPGVTNQFNQALFADWSQSIIGAVSWHSYAEVLNSRGLIDEAPASPLASGVNGTPQATIPGSNAGLTSSLPLSLEDQTLTFSTGPSFKLQKDLSANVEYTNRWDKNPAPGSFGQEQRVSVSVKGTF